MKEVMLIVVLSASSLVSAVFVSAPLTKLAGSEKNSIDTDINFVNNYTEVLNERCAHRRAIER